MKYCGFLKYHGKLCRESNMQWYVGKCLKLTFKEKEIEAFVEFTNFHGVNSPTLANFKTKYIWDSCIHSTFFLIYEQSSYSFLSHILETSSCVFNFS